jgi:hypothetical protein
MADISYLIETNVLIDGQEEPLMLDGMTRSIEIIHDYDHSVYPLLKLDADLSLEMFRKIQDNDSVKFSITIKKYKQTDLDQGTTSLFSYYIKDKTFLLFDRDKNFINVPTDNSSANDPSVTGMPMYQTSFYLMAEEDLSNSRRMVNSVLVDVDMEGAILYLTNKISRKPTLFQRPDNQRIYKQILLPPNNVIRTIKYLNDVYGLYNKGLRLYFDLDAYYIINKNDNKGLKGFDGRFRNVLINVYSESSSNADSLLYEDAPADESNGYSSRVSISDLVVVNYEDSKREFIGTDNIFVSQTQEEFKKRNYSNDSDNSKTRVFYNRYNNAYKESELMNDYSKGFFVAMTVTDLDIDAISCSNEYYLSMDQAPGYEGYAGEYHIMKSNILFAVGTANYSTMSSKIYLRKK